MILKRKYFIPAMVIILAIAGSIYYVFFRENEIEVSLNKSRLIINERFRNIELKRNFELERFPIRLQLDFDRFLKDLKSIQLRKEWTAELEFGLTHQPFFDLRNIYLVSFDKIAVYDKTSLNNIWREQLDNDIASVSLIDGNNILLIDVTGRIYALSRSSGKQSWTTDTPELYTDNLMYAMRPLHITNSDDKRLLTSIIVVPLQKDLQIIDSITGEILFTLELEDDIYHLSDYDPIDNAIYVSYGNKIGKIILEKI